MNLYRSVGARLRRIASGTLRERTGGSRTFVCDKTMLINVNFTLISNKPARLRQKISNGFYNTYRAN
jgi:hypothetical protein